MADIPGDDRYDATGEELLDMVDALVAIQRAWAGRTEELLALGLPDWRSPFLSTAIADVIDRTADQLTVGERATLDGFLADLAARLAAVEDCGLPDTLVHGDFAPGNVRGDGRTAPMTLLDWGDSTVGQPLLDRPAFLDRTPAGEAATIRAHWEARLACVVPGRRRQRRRATPRPRRRRAPGRGVPAVPGPDRSRQSGPTTPAIRRTGCVGPSPSSRATRAAP